MLKYIIILYCIINTLFSLRKHSGKRCLHVCMPVELDRRAELSCVCKNKKNRRVHTSHIYFQYRTLLSVIMEKFAIKISFISLPPGE